MTKLIIEEPIEIKGQAVTPKMRVWVGKDKLGLAQFHKRPEFYSETGLFVGQTFYPLDGLDFPEIKEGECVEYEITFKRVEK